MCYNLATKCTICSEFVDSKVMKCLGCEVYLNIDGIWIRGCETTNTVDGWPFFDQYRLRSPDVTCPNGGTLRLHGVRVLDALCYTCYNDNPGSDDPKNKDSYVGERCGSVYAADYERKAIHYVGSYLHLGSKPVTGHLNDEATYFVFFSPNQLEDWFSGKRKKIDTRQEYIQADRFPYAASKLDKAYCAETTQWQHAINESNTWPVAKLESMGAPWLPPPPQAPETQGRKRTAEDMDMADPQMRIPPVVPPSPVPLAIPQLQASGDLLDPILRQLSWESGQSGPTTLSYNNSQQNSALLSTLTTPPTPWLDEDYAGPSTLFPEVPAERARAAVTAAGGYATLAASVNAAAQAHGISVSPGAQARRATQQNATGLNPEPVDPHASANTNDIDVPVMVLNQQAPVYRNEQQDATLHGLFPELADVDPFTFPVAGTEQNAMLTYAHPVARPATVDAIGVQRDTMHMGGGTVAAPAPFLGADVDSFFEDAMRFNQQPVESNDEAWRYMTTLSPGAGDGAFDDQTFS